MGNKSASFLRNIGVFALGNFTIKFTQFMMISLCTYTLTTSDYGVADAIVQAASLLIPIIGLGINESFFRFPIDDFDNRSHIFTNCTVSLITSIVAATVIAVIVEAVGIVSCEVVLYTLLLLVFEMTNNSFKQFVRGSGNSRAYIAGGVINCLLQVTSFLLLVLCLGMGYVGYLISMVVAYAVEIAFYLTKAKLIFLFDVHSISFRGIKKYIKYSLPLAPNSIMWWFSNASGRYFLIFFFDTAVSGVYAVATKIPALITFVAGFVVDAWKISAVAEYDLEGPAKEESSKFQSHVFEALYVSAILFSMLLIVLIRPILSIFVSQAYFEAWECSVVLLVGIVFYAMQQFLGSYYTVSKQTFGALKSTSIGAVINVVLNIILISRFGMMGAAIATAVSYIVIFIYRYFDTRKYVELTVNWRKFYASILGLFAMSILVWLNNPYCSIASSIIVLLTLLVNRRFLFGIIRSAASLFIRG